MRSAAITLCALYSFMAGCDPADLADDNIWGHGNSEVIGGDLTPAGMYPATGALISEGQPSCTGTLIAPDVVLTAAHCLDPTFIGGTIPGFTLALDARGVSSSSIVAGRSAHQHPEFDLWSDGGSGLQQWYDIAILLLADEITDVPYEVLPTVAEAEAELRSGIAMEITGYGLTDPDGYDYGVKHHGQADLVEVGQWELLVAQPGQQQNCNGDSGGPGFVNLSGGRRLAGIVSRAPDDNARCDHGGIDTRVDAYLDWIYSIAAIPTPGAADAGVPDAVPPPEEPDAAPIPEEPDAGIGPAGPDGGDPMTGFDAGGSSSNGGDVSAGCGCRVGAAHTRSRSDIFFAFLVAAGSLSTLRRGRFRSPSQAKRPKPRILASLAPQASRATQLRLA